MNERWKPIPGYEGYYSASNIGRIRRERSVTRAKAGHIMKLTPTRDDYLSVGLCRDGRAQGLRVHRLVWQAFNGAIPDGHVVNHKDGNKSGNRLENLECITTRENILHAFRELGRRRPGEKLDAKKAAAIRTLRAHGQALKEIACEYNMTGACVSSVCTGKTWKHAGGPITEPRRMSQAPKDVVDRIDSATVAEVVRRYRDGDGTTVLAEEFGVSQRTILNWAQGKTRHR